MSLNQIQQSLKQLGFGQLLSMRLPVTGCQGHWKFIAAVKRCCIPPVSLELKRYPQATNPNVARKTSSLEANVLFPPGPGTDALDPQNHMTFAESDLKTSSYGTATFGVLQFAGTRFDRPDRGSQGTATNLLPDLPRIFTGAPTDKKILQKTVRYSKFAVLGMERPASSHLQNDLVLRRPSVPGSGAPGATALKKS